MTKKILKIIDDVDELVFEFHAADHLNPNLSKKHKGLLEFWKKNITGEKVDESQSDEKQEEIKQQNIRAAQAAVEQTREECQFIKGGFLEILEKEREEV